MVLLLFFVLCLPSMSTSGTVLDPTVTHVLIDEVDETLSDDEIERLCKKLTRRTAEISARQVRVVTHHWVLACSREKTYLDPSGGGGDAPFLRRLKRGVYVE